MLPIILISIAGALVLGVAIFVIVWQIRTRHFRPNPDKDQQQREINRDIEAAGFAYDRRRDLFYSRMDCWQRKMGYCRLYDEASPGFNMIMHCEPVTFSYAGKRWLIELWKGQYGITTGGEIGIYNTDKEDIHSEKFTGTFYENIPDEERLPMSFVLRRNGKSFFRCKGIHWWLTGFKLGAFSLTDSLSMDAKIRFPNRDMCQAFVGGLRGVGYRPHEYTVRHFTVTIHYDTPHTVQPLSQNIAGEAIVQQTNENNCRLYNTVTHKYSDTLDKLEYLKAAMPELYEFCMNSLYARGFYEAFDWLLDLVHGGRKPHPCPPEPCPPPPPPCPCPPCPPDPPEPPCRQDCYVMRPLPGTCDGVLLCPVPCPPGCSCDQAPKPCPCRPPEPCPCLPPEPPEPPCPDPEPPEPPEPPAPCPPPPPPCCNSGCCRRRCGRCRRGHSCCQQHERNGR